MSKALYMPILPFSFIRLRGPFWAGSMEPRWQSRIMWMNVTANLPSPLDEAVFLGPRRKVPITRSETLNFCL